MSFAKKVQGIVVQNLSLADELKVVIFHPSDFEWAEQYAQLVKPETKLFLQPEYSRFDKMTNDSGLCKDSSSVAVFASDA